MTTSLNTDLDLSTRTFFNPVQNDTAILLESAAETDGARTRFEIHCWAGGGNQPHYHKSYSETFTVLEGELTVLLGDQTLVLRPGDSATVPIGVRHCFRNHTDQLCRFEVLIQPGHTGFEHAIQIGYGLARDGQCNSESIPRSLRALAYLLAISDMRMSGPMALIERALLWLARRPKTQRLGAELQARYVTL